MKKITTMYEKDPNNLGRVINKLREEHKWVIREGIPMRKYDGTACAIIDGKLYKRYDAKINKKTGKRKVIPEGAIPCQAADPYGSHPHWVKCNRNNPEDKYHFEGFNNLIIVRDGTYELCGEKVQGNPEGFIGHILIKHDSFPLENVPLNYVELKQYLTDMDIEGIVFHHKKDGRMCKIRKSDFGIKR